MVQIGLKMWSKLIERLAYHALLNLIVPGISFFSRFIIIISFIGGLVLEYFNRKASVDEKKVLQELNRLIGLIDSGNSPRYSFEQVDIAPFPDYLSHPLDDYFNPSIFKRQVELFEKTILMHSELEAEFSIVRYRMSLMKFLPLAIMIGLQQFMKPNPGPINLFIIIGFLSSYYVAESIGKP